jgi:hypothetical protein
MAFGPAEAFTPEQFAQLYEVEWVSEICSFHNTYRERAAE